MEELIAIILSFLIGSGLVSAYLIIVKNKLKQISTVLVALSRVVVTLDEALRDDKITKEEVEQLVKEVTDLVEIIKQLIGR